MSTTKATEDMTVEEMLAESARIDLEMKRVTLELNRESLQTLKDSQERRLMKLRKQERDLAENLRIKEARQKACKHKKGGRNKEGFAKGNSANYAVIQHTYPAGDVVVLCQRCDKTWEMPLPALRISDPDLYQRQLREYRMALEWPTDNEPSGTRLFLITDNGTGRVLDTAQAEAVAPRRSKKKASKAA
jgi:hypothetical protein